MKKVAKPVCFEELWEAGARDVTRNPAKIFFGCECQKLD